MQLLPTNVTAPRYRMRLELDGVSYVLVYRYNTRNNGWHLDILDADEAPLHLGIKLVRNWPLFLRDVDTRFPPGMLYAISYGSGQVGREGLLTRDTSMSYFSEAEYQQILDTINAADPADVVTFAPVV